MLIDKELVGVPSMSIEELVWVPLIVFRLSCGSSMSIGNELVGGPLSVF